MSPASFARVFMLALGWALAVPTVSAAQATASPSPEGMSTPKLTVLQEELQNQCTRHFPGKIQGELRGACTSAPSPIVASEKGLAQTKCRLAFGEDPRAVMACLIGVSISVDLTEKRDGFKEKLQLCAEHYPQHTEVDGFFQESCLTGIHLPELLPALSGQPYESCGQLTSERSFIGPCAVGLSLSTEIGKPGIANKQNKICEQYFDHKRFHQTYRACLNGGSVALVDRTKASEVINACSNISMDPQNDNERAACVIGSNIHRSLQKNEDISQRFSKCGTNKVSYQDREVLACLTAASLIDIVGKPNAEAGCKDVFKATKGGSRGDCLNSLSQMF